MNTKMIGLVLVGFLILVVATYVVIDNNPVDAPGITQDNSTIQNAVNDQQSASIPDTDKSDAYVSQQTEMKTIPFGKSGSSSGSSSGISSSSSSGSSSGSANPTETETETETEEPTEIPEYGTIIIPVAAVLGLMFILSTRKKIDK